ncbi:BUD14 (YAR014C) [Zygosaccharomyces parabailii]|nr:BUD14 (YAR014C) [Zygosaccharomyces parabailii]
MSQGPSVNAFHGSISPSLLPAEFGGKLSLDDPDRRDLLNDPSLTENYADLVKMKPNLPTEHEGESNSGSVVVTGESPVKRSGGSSPGNYAGLPEAEEQRDEDYDYTDSEFEESLEKRLQDMDTGLPGDRRGFSGGGSASGTNSVYDGLMMSLSEEDDDDLHLEDEDEDQQEDYEGAFEDEEELQPLPPPQELDPDKLYALYAFSGPDPSHCQLKQDEPCTLLNDQDAYWWLVRRNGDNKIGFAPAEILETYPERLARLNCWKNENMSPRKAGWIAENGLEYEQDHEPGQSDDDEEEGKTLHGEDDMSNPRLALKEYGKGNKSVSFNDVISYADRYIEDEDDKNDEDEPNQYDEFSESTLKTSRSMEDDDLSEATSDASFNTASMVPLNVEKRRQTPEQQLSQKDKENTSDEEIVKEINENRTSFIETHDGTQQNGSFGRAEDEPIDEKREEKSIEETQDGLHKIFEAPVLPFSRKTSQMETSNSDYSISTIGEFSPSSSEWTSDSPQQHIADHQSPRTIPPSRAIQDLTKIVGKDDESAATLQVDQEQKSKSIKSRHIKETPASSSSSSEESFMEAERVASSTSVNSTSSAPRQQLFHSTSYISATSGKHHPLIDRLYNPIFDRMDDLLKEIDKAGE